MNNRKVLLQDETQKIHWGKDKTDRRAPDHPVVAATFNPLAAIVASLVENPENSSVLDVGCGNGFLSFALEKQFGNVEGLDNSSEMLSINPCKKKHLGSSTALPFANKSFDIAVASHMLHHLVESDCLKTLSEMQRVARVAIVSFEPNRNNPLMFLFSMIKKEERMALRFSSAYMTKLFSGLDLTSYSTFVKSWIVPNKAPVWWIPVGQFLSKTPMQKLGFDICCTGMLKGDKEEA